MPWDLSLRLFSFIKHTHYHGLYHTSEGVTSLSGRPNPHHQWALTIPSLHPICGSILAYPKIKYLNPNSLQWISTVSICPASVFLGELPLPVLGLSIKVSYLDRMGGNTTKASPVGSVPSSCSWWWGQRVSTCPEYDLACGYGKRATRALFFLDHELSGWYTHLPWPHGRYRGKARAHKGRQSQDRERGRCW